MIIGTITIKLQHYWHCGSGQSGPGDVDLVPVVEDCGLPYAPGKHLKGRLKQAGREFGFDDAELFSLFGKEDGTEGTDSIILELTHAKMRGDFASACRRYFAEHKHQAPEIAALFEDIASTATENGVAMARSLRRIRYAVPVTLTADYTLYEDALLDDLKQCVASLSAIGHGKHDGYGWCQRPAITHHVVHPSNDEAVAAPETTAFDLDLTLLDDVVFSATSATEGGHRTLDYAPGSALMGAAAKLLFQTLREEAGALALARGDVSFGNAYVTSRDGAATLPLPIAWHHAKTEKASADHALVEEHIYNFARVEWEHSPIADQQPVQMREGYYHPKTGELPRIERRQSLRTAISPNLEDYEVAETGKLFGYEALAAGTTLRSRIEVRGEQAAQLCSIIQQAFGGDGKIIRLGRSKATEYGRAECKLSTAGEIERKTASGTVRLLALSDLALLDRQGRPTLRPEGYHFGLVGWHLCETHSFLRFRRYSQWNAKRGGPDIERQVISKGSVLVFVGAGEVRPETRVGIGQGEGLGRVLVAKEWLDEEQPKFRPSDSPKDDKPSTATATLNFTPGEGDIFGTCIAERHLRKNADTIARKLASAWTKTWISTGTSVSASQWRSLGDQLKLYQTIAALLTKLGDTEQKNDKTFFGGNRGQAWAGKPGQPATSLAAAVRHSLGSTIEAESLKLKAFGYATAAMAHHPRRTVKSKS